MYDGSKILAGIAVFLAVVLLPVWHNVWVASAPRPEVKIAPGAEQCVDTAAVMRATHMNVLDRWRDAVVRDGIRTTTTPTGMTVPMSLTKTCMKCHYNKKEFCDACHNYLAVSPTCWQCHVEPQPERKESSS